MAHYAKSGDLNIAYIVEGRGATDLVWIPPWISQVEYLWAEPMLAAVMGRLTQFARVITFDRRGSGLSDPFFGAPTLEEQMDDVLAVLDAAGSKRAAIAGTLEGGPMAALFAATYPERIERPDPVRHLRPRHLGSGLRLGLAVDERDARMAELVDHWGEGLVVGAVAPSRMDDPTSVNGRADWSGSPPALRSIRRIFELIGRFDVRDVLPSIRVPTLAASPPRRQLHQRSNTRATSPPASREPGWSSSKATKTCSRSGDSEAILGEIEEFLTGTRPEREPDRMLATVMFTDIVESTRRAADMGDRGWRFLLERHDALFRRALERHRGREVKRTGDGFLATFDGPARAIRCAASLADAMGSLGLEVRAGLHTGELEVMNGDLGGLAVHIAARVMERAGPCEVLVSSTVRDLVVGSELAFEDRGAHELRGVPGEWRLFAVG